MWRALSKYLSTYLTYGHFNTWATYSRVIKAVLSMFLNEQKLANVQP